MSTALQHYIRTRGSLAKSRMRSASDRVYDPVPDLTLGDARLHELYFVDDSTGLYESFSGAGYATPSVRVGTPGSANQFSGASFTAITNGWQFTLSPTGAPTSLQMQIQVAITAGMQTYARLPVYVSDRVT